jgi:YHS domain-containing protein
MSSTTVVKDPVCGMEIETAAAAGHTEHAGQTYYLSKSTAAPKTGQGCCG